MTVTERDTLKSHIINGMEAFSSKMKINEQDNICAFLILLGRLAYIEESGAGTYHVVESFDKLMIALNRCKTQGERLRILEEYVEIFLYLIQGRDKEAKPHIERLKAEYSNI